jgi:hypothetical protein
MRDAISKTVDYLLDMKENPEKYCPKTRKLLGVLGLEMEQ